MPEAASRPIIRMTRGKHFHERAGDPTDGAIRDRTDDLLIAMQALSQLSYGPSRGQMSVISNQKRRAPRLITDI